MPILENKKLVLKIEEKVENVVYSIAAEVREANSGFSYDHNFLDEKIERMELVICIEIMLANEQVIYGIVLQNFMGKLDFNIVNLEKGTD